MSDPTATGVSGLVLIVDDDEDSRHLLRHLLERRGYRVAMADGGRAALERVADGDVDVILLDVMMPVMDGFDVCRELKRSPETARIPIILLTARDDMETRAVGMNLGVSDFLAKPVNTGELFRRVSIQIESRQHEQQLDLARRRAETIS